MGYENAKKEFVRNAAAFGRSTRSQIRQPEQVADGVEKRMGMGLIGGGLGGGGAERGAGLVEILVLETAEGVGDRFALRGTKRGRRKLSDCHPGGGRLPPGPSG